MGKKTFKSTWLIPLALIGLYLVFNGGNDNNNDGMGNTPQASASSSATAPQALTSPLPPSDFAYDLNCKVMTVTDDVTLVCLTDEKQKVRVKLGQVDIPQEELASIHSAYPSEFKPGDEPKTVAQIVALQAPANIDQGTGNFSCAGKRYCKQMTNCAEAKFYLNQCGLTRLDADGDGIPCESLCR